jgi:hypothetical protein
MSFLANLFDPPASQIPTPVLNSAQSYGAQAPTPFGYTAPGTPNTFAPNYLSGAEQGFFSGIPGLGQYNLYGRNLPQAQGIGQGMINSPYAGAYQAGAGPAGMMGMGAGLNAYGAGQGLYGLGGQIASTAFDPQNALYQRTLGQVQDQTGAALAQAGLGTTPYGAGVMGNTLSNFNIDWMNQQLARQMQGGAAAGNLIQQGAGLQAGAPSTFLQGAGTPWGIQQTLGQANLGTLGSLGQLGTGAGSQAAGQLGQYQNYLTSMYPYLAQSAAAPMQAYGLGLQGMGQAFTQQQQAGFQDPYMLAQQQNQGAMNVANWQLAQSQLAGQQQAQAFSGLGSLAGMILGGPIGGALGGGLSGMFGGGGGGGYGGYNPAAGAVPSAQQGGVYPMFR